MYHSIAETSHPLQAEEQEVGIDPLQSYVNKPDEDVSNENGGLHHGSDSVETFISYSKEWEELFVNNNYLATIRLKGINGQLRSSRFRSVCWKLFLNVLPSDRNQWISKTTKLRTLYNNIKEIHITNPRKAGQQDLMINNPLSQDEGSLWNKFFQDKELRGMIEQDVTRTFPEMQYFQEENVRKILTDVLFCYARENEQLLYKQGMHELLAPIVFILHCDHQAFLHASEAAQPSEEMKVLLNPEYLEHDAYAVFIHLMKTAEHWFSTYEHDSQKEKDAMMTPIPFARPQDLGPSIAIVAKVNQIQDHLLKKHDIELYMHLNRLEIAPQIYGLTNLNLGHDSTMDLPPETLPTILTITLKIHPVTMLPGSFLVISSNYQTCLGLLMHYPPIGDVHSLILRALFLRDPKRNPRPVTYQFQQNLDYYKARGADLMNKTRVSAKVTPLNINKVSSSLLNFGRKLISPAITSGGATGPVVGSSGSFSSVAVPIRSTVEFPQQQQQRMMKSESVPVQLSKGDIVTGSDAQVSVPVQNLSALQGTVATATHGQSSKNVSSSPSIDSLSGGREYTGSPPLSATKKESFFNTISHSRSHSRSISKKEAEEELEGQISFLQGQLNELEAMCKYCAKMMNTHLGNIQELILQEHLEKEDEILVSLAGLKQIKDILKGSLRFNQSQLEAEENEQITIEDDHYCSNNWSKETSEAMEQLSVAKQPLPPVKQAVDDSSGSSANRRPDDYILHPKEEEGNVSPAPGHVQTVPTCKDLTTKNEAPCHTSLAFSDPLMGSISASSSNLSSSPDDDSSSNSKDSDFTIVSPLEI
ncbi:TBC1 domain family member 5 isoform X2 [Rhineura floridana]|uniref:TBC1 domain family member 5 isoform X2 n=1 Tax=Rhineura floridana TaxID=261503 RepID=UPI002AC88C95|nr:TBC1 domain family member 5 isoform X2 [Rhineura floridana]